MHYKDGTEAQLGDMARGKPFNTPHEVVGLVGRITPGSGSCNMVVFFVGKERIAEEQPGGNFKGMGPFPCVKYDYANVGDFELVSRG